MSMLAFALRDPAVNRDRLIKICLVHDLAEALVGDITPHDQKITKEQKRVLEEVRHIWTVAIELHVNCPQ